MSGSNDDWFEKALREAEDDDSPDDGASDGDALDGESGTDTFDGESDAFGGESESDGFDGESDAFGSESESDGFDGESDAFGGESDGDAFGGERDAPDGPTGGSNDSFGGIQSDDGGDAFGGVPDDATGGDGSPDSDDPFGGVRSSSPAEGTTEGSSNGDDPFGGVRSSGPAEQTTGGSSNGDDPFGGVQSSGPTEETTGGSANGDDPFGGVRSSGDAEDAFGEGFEAAMGGVGGGGEEFDEEELESEIDRLNIGIEGLDEMILGGVPIRSLITVIGSAGTGKTTFGLQFLHEALREGGKCVYITLEETEESIISSAEEKGWPFSEYVADGSLVVVSMDPIEMANSLDSIRGDLTRLINDFGADRLVLDSVSLLEMMYDDPATRRSEVFDFARSLKRAGVTTMLTSEANADNPFQSRHGLVEYLVDAVFVLRYVRPSDFQETRLAVEIQKIRDANHSRETKPYDITTGGIAVHRQANIF